MSQEQNQLRFSVEESVWFQKGQEVSELLSISLDPDISIHEHDQYISIRGALQLTGEYMIEKEAQSNNEQYEYANVRYVNEVQTNDEGVSVLAHRFPVDITIPRNRIDNLEEVFVSIETFDYEIPDEKCLKLVADLSISGILNDQMEVVEEPADDREEIELDEEELEEAEPSLRENAHVPAQEDEAIQPEETIQDIEQPFSAFFQGDTGINEEERQQILNEAANLSEEELVLETRNEQEQIREETNNEQTDAQTVELEDDTSEIDEVSEEAIVQIDEEQPQNESKEENNYEPAVIEVRKEREMESEEPQEVQYTFYSKSEQPTDSLEQEEVEDIDREEDKAKDAHYLTSLFARDEDEDFSRVKMCIVQQGDTIDQICERYDISVQQLLRVNNFHADQDVYEGQILYIPDYSVSK